MTRFVHMALVAALAALVSTLANLGLEARLWRPVPSRGVVPAPRVRPSVGPEVSTPKLQKLLGLVTETGTPLTAPAVGDSAARRFHAGHLRGTLVSADAPDFSLALIAVDSKAASYTVGDSVLGAEVVRIERTRVWVRAGEETQFIDGEVVTAGAGGRGGWAGGGMRITKRSETEFNVARDEVFQALKSPAADAKPPRVLPVFRDGVVQGFRLDVGSNALLAQLGFETGDVVKRVNGQDVNNPSVALELYSHLNDLKRVELEFERQGRLVRRSYTLE